MANYSLRLYSPLLMGADFLDDVTEMAQDWRRSTRLVGGPWLGSFRLIGDLPLLQQWYYNLLGAHLEERASGITSWAGLIYEMDLTYQGVKRRRSLDLLSNAVKARYITFEQGNELLTNAGFEDTGGLTGWTAPGAAMQSADYAHGGTYSAKIPGTSPADYIYQAVAVPESARTGAISFWYYNVKTPMGAGYKLYDVTNAADIIPLTALDVTEDTWLQIQQGFAVPEGCTEVALYLYGPTNAATTYFDDASVKINESVVVESAWFTNANSIARYGRKEEYISLDGYLSSAAEARAQTQLAEYGVPRSHTVGVEKAKRSGRTVLPPNVGTLDVTVAGYVFTVNWQYVTVLDGGRGYVSEWIGDILTTDCPFLSGVEVAENDLEVIRHLSMPQRAWDTVAELTDLGDDTGWPWRLWVDVNRMAHYAPLDNTPLYVWYNGGLYDRIGASQEVDPFLVVPGVVRDTQYPVDPSESSLPFLADARDSLITEVEAGADGSLQLKTGLFTEGEIIAAQQESGVWR